MAVRATRLFFQNMQCNGKIFTFVLLSSYVSERLKNYNVEQTKLEPTNCLDIAKCEFLLLENKTFDNFNQIHANKYYVTYFFDKFLSWVLVTNYFSQIL